MSRRTKTPDLSILIAALALFFVLAQGLFWAPAAGDDLYRKIGLQKLLAARQAPDFTVKDTSGNSVSLANFRGRAVFLNFWATWCTPCRREMPSMERLHQKLAAKGLVMLAVDWKESKREVAKFMSDFQLTFHALLDLDGGVYSRYRITALPSTYVIDPRGRMIGMKVGPRDWAAPESVEFFDGLVRVKQGSDSYVVDAVPTIPIPSKVFARAAGVQVHAEQEPHSGVVVKLGKGDELTILLNMSGGGEEWYMIRTGKGVVGWVKAAETTQSK